MNLICENDVRREAVRASGYNGLDYLEVSDDQRKLTVFFLGKAPKDLQKANVRLTGGRRVRDIQITGVEIIRQKDPELDDQLIVKVDKPGDYSTYRLCLVALDGPPDAPPDAPFPGFDPRYDCLEFSFKAGCPSDLDCQPPDLCPPERRPQPEINYLAKDYASFRQLILDRLSILMPEWRERHVPDLGIALVELLAYTGDYLSYYQDAVATEAYLDTARQRISVRRHARLVDYFMHEGCNARAWVCLWTDTDRVLPDDFYLITGQTLPVPGRVLSPDDLASLPAARYEVFEPLRETPAPIHLYAAHNRISFYTWGDGAEGGECCLSQGTTSATLKDGWKPTPEGEPSTQAYTPERELHLQPGDILIFEEVLGPRTGNPADADPTHRHAVRLTRVTPDVDPLYEQPVLEIEWAEEDALPFPLCLSATSAAPDCAPLEDVSVACGNVILVDHGRRISDEDLGCVPTARTEEACPDPCHPPEIRLIPGKYRPTLKEIPLTFRQPLSLAAPAQTLLDQDPRLALPWIRLTSKPASQQVGKTANEQTNQPANQQINKSTNLQTFNPSTQQWLPQYDLLSSSPDDPHYVVEMDDARRSHLRFGNGEMGKQPEAGTCFTATYRIGDPLAGNVGAGTITHIVFAHSLSGADIRPRNPLPARGGTLPEPVQQVKLFAPRAFRRLERAILPEDYAAIVLRDFPHKVQRAAATLRWMGSWYEVLVVVDPKGTDTADPALFEEIAGHLYRYRRIGHDLSVQPARYVPLDVSMTVCVKPGYLRGQVNAALLNLFSNRNLPDGNRGFFHPDALTFGEGVYLSHLIAAAQAVPGVESVKVTRLQRLFETPNGELENGVLPLGLLEIARLDNDPGFPENGSLTLKMEGGR